MFTDKLIYLASASPRRRELLMQLGVRFEALPADIPETQRPGESPRDYVLRMASEKAEAVSARIAREARPAHPVLGADTAVVLGDELMGKPRDREHALQLLQRLSGVSHDVLTGLCIVHGGRRYQALSESRVTFGPLTPGQIERYWASGEAQDKAGAYGIQGLAAGFVSRLEGSYSGVVGLPLYELVQLLKQTGIDWP